MALENWAIALETVSSDKLRDPVLIQLFILFFSYKIDLDIFI